MFIVKLWQRVTRPRLHDYLDGLAYGVDIERRATRQVCDLISCTNKNGEYVYVDDLFEYLENPELLER
jgi:hypothetical protein